MNTSGLLERFAPYVVQVQVAGRGGGSGVVWDTSSVVTNAHVVGRASTVEVLTHSGQRLEAQVTALQEADDLARLELDHGLPVPIWGDSSALRLGELVLALGHPYGENWLLTAGIVSGLGEHSLPGQPARELIRSDVRLRPGNSGGALLSARGEVVGVNAMVLSGDLGAAIPERTVRRFLTRPAYALGLELGPVALPEIGVRFQVRGLVPGGAAQRGGLSLGDVLLELGDRPLASVDALLERVRQGQPAPLMVWRSGQRVQLSVRPEPLPARVQARAA